MAPVFIGCKKMSKPEAPQPYDNIGASKEAIQYHYDVGNDFYAWILGPTMCYSAALWLEDPSADDLDSAQRRKLDWHIAGSRADRTKSVLDVGCGWGSTLFRAVETGALERAVGLTLSDAQADWIRQSGPSIVEPLVVEWQSYESAESFDSIISIGAFEHFVSPSFGTDEKVKSYRDFFRFCDSKLNAGGRLSLQTIAWLDMEPAEEIANLPEEMFPDSNLPRLSEIAAAAEDVLNIMHVGAHAMDYAHTLRRWNAKLRTMPAELSERYAPELVKRYRRNFTGFTLGFGAGKITLYRIILEKRP